MSDYAVLFVAALTILLLATPVVRACARSSGRAAVPRLGGVGIALGMFLPIVALVLVGADSVGPLGRDGAMLGLIVGGLAMVLLGLVDDVVGLTPWTKLGTQAIIASFAWLAGYRIEWVTNPFGDPLALGALAFPVTIVWIVGIVNALNLIDGLDGLAAGVTLIAVGGSFLLALERGETWFLPVAAALGGATLGFLFYNFYPATIHMGDSGSLLLGYVLAVTAIQGGHKSGTAFALLVPIVMLGLPILDTMLTIARRASSGHPILAADDHIHHRLMALGWSVRQVVLGLYAVCCGLAAAALALAYGSSAEAAIVIAGLGLAAFVLVRGLGYLRRDAGRAAASVPSPAVETAASVAGTPPSTIGS